MNAEATGSAAAVEQKPKNQSMRAGYICLAVASVAILVAGPLGWILAAPLSLTALILGIVGLTKGNTAKGIILVISAFVVPTLIQVVQLVVLAGSLASRGH